MVRVERGWESNGLSYPFSPAHTYKGNSVILCQRGGLTLTCYTQVCVIKERLGGKNEHPLTIKSRKDNVKHEQIKRSYCFI